MKKVISVLMCLLLCFSFSVTASAKTVPTNAVQPYYENAREAKSELIINGTTTTCEPEKSENEEEVEEDKPSVIKQIKDIKAKSEQPPGPKLNVPPEKKEEQEI